MERIHQIRDEALRSKENLDTSSLQGESFLTANESSSAFYSLTEEDSTFIVSPSKDSSSTSNAETSITDTNIICNIPTIQPIQKSNDVESFKIGKQIEAANILSGGVNIFDDNSYDGDELIIDDSPLGGSKEKKGDGNVILDKTDDTLQLGHSDAIPSKETEVVLQIDGKNVDAIDIGNGLYLYRKTGEEELAAVQIIDDDHQQPSFKFLKVRENAEGNLEVYEEIEIEVPKDMPVKEGKPTSNISQTPTKNDNKNNCLKDNVETTQKYLKNELDIKNLKAKGLEKSNKDVPESKSELNFNGKTMKFNDSRKSPVIGTFTPMTYHSTPNKEGRPLTKTMVDQHLQPNRHSENIKKTIEVTTDNCKQKITEHVVKMKDESDSKHELSEKTNETLKILPPEKVGDDKNCLQELKNIDISNVSKIDKDVGNKHIEIVKNISANNSDELDQNINDNKITPDAITLPNEICNSEKSVKLINQDVEADAIKNMSYNTTPLESVDVLSDIMEIDADDKLVIAEDALMVSETVNEPTPKPVESFGLPTSKANCDVEVSDLDSVIKSCENNVKNIEESEKPICDDKKLKITQEIKEKSTIDEKSNTTRASETTRTLQVLDIKEKDDERSSCENKIKEKSILTGNADKNTILGKVISKPSVIIEKKDCTLNQIPEKEIKNISKSMHLDDKSLMPTNVTSLTQVVIEKTIDKDPSKQLETMSSSNIHSLLSPKIENTSENKTKDKKELSVEKFAGCKVTSKVSAAVPFGKWTEANRQEFLNKIKESKVTTNNLHTKQIKQPNDLNRRDFLKKIDSQRQVINSIAAKSLESNSKTFNVKSGSAVFNSTSQTIEKQATAKMPKITPKECLPLKTKAKPTTENTKNKYEVPQALPTKLKLTQRKEINNQVLIDKTIEGIINRALPVEVIKDEILALDQKTNEIKKINNTTLDDIERKMNELHGIPFVERPFHELPALESKQHDIDNICENKKVISTNIAPHQNTRDVKNIEKSNISDEEIIEHEPITGDIGIIIKDKTPQQAICSSNGAKKESIITEKDFDKFARRNSVTYENCLTVKFDKSEPHNVKQRIVPKDLPMKKMSRNELMLAESKAKSTHKHHIRHNIHSSKIPTAVKTLQDDSVNKNYQSKVQIAYQTALTAKWQQEPVAIIEDKPVKVVFMDTNPDFVPVKLNVQGQQLSPSNKSANDNIQITSEPVDSNVIGLICNPNISPENKSKAKHQRKQVLTPVETPELELIETKDLGLESSLKKKRRVDERSDKKPKVLLPKKTYLLNLNNEDDKQTKPQDLTKISNLETVNKSESYVVHSNPISAIDNLVKAAELLETQSENKIIENEEGTIKKENPPTKRGRGRPRKYPLPGSENDLQTSSITSKDKPDKNKASNSQTDTEDSSNDEIINENWTMGKINENILCPICNKLFRSENVVFKHVKHCTGPSPNRSESDNRRSYRLRRSNDSKKLSIDSDSEEDILTPRKRKSRDSKPVTKCNEDINKTSNETLEKLEAVKPKEKKVTNLKNKITNLVCKLCGKTFRQLSYLLSHKLQHKREDVKNLDNRNKNIFCCEVCKKEFRKLHHLVQHRLIHDRKVINLRQNRKISSEFNENKQIKTQPLQKKIEDNNTGFRCEPCDKSFRKLHHLVEHRETHDGINKKMTANATEDISKAATLHQCDTCNKTFKKLQYLMEHKDQHFETSSEKSDDKSVQSSLSTRDIIHECSLCYMVFPNEHSLNKHFVNCQRKKKQSAKKQLKTDEQISIKEENIEDAEAENNKQMKDGLVPDIIDLMTTREVTLTEIKSDVESADKIKSELACDKDVVPVVINSNLVDDSDAKSDDLPLIVKTSVIASKVSQIPNAPKPLTKADEIKTIVISDTPTPKKRMAVKEKLGITVSKKQKIHKTLPIKDENKVESSDDDEVRYMLNPHYQDMTSEEKFMKVRAEKRSSLQIERPNSKDLAKRRISLQHPPKIPRLKTKMEAQPIKTLTNKKSNSSKTAATDSDDSEVKYSFPKGVDNSVAKIVDKVKRKSLGGKRKSLTGVAKRKSLGKQKTILSPKLIRKRAEVEHRCDCGQLFSSAALLSRHTTLAHTPPRIRKRRSPPPENVKLKQTKIAVKTHPKQARSLKNQTQKQNTQIPKKSTQVKAQPKTLGSRNSSDDKEVTRKSVSLRGKLEKSRKVK